MKTKWKKIGMNSFVFVIKQVMLKSYKIIGEPGKVAKPAAACNSTHAYNVVEAIVML